MCVKVNSLKFVGVALKYEVNIMCSQLIDAFLMNPPIRQEFFLSNMFYIDMLKLNFSIVYTIHLLITTQIRV